MKITKLTVRQFEGLESLEVQPSESITLIEGRNGTGKTTILDAIRVAFTNKGERSLLVRDGANNGLVLFELSDGTTGERSVFDSGRTAGPIELHDHNGNPIGAAQRFLNRLGLGFGFNPLAFVEMSPTNQTKQLLEVTPVAITLPELLALSGGNRQEIDYRQHPLVVLKAIEDLLAEQRRIAGRDARDTEGMVEKLRSEVPKDFDRLAAQEFDLNEAMSEFNTITQTARETERLTSRLKTIKDRVAELHQQIAALEVTYTAHCVALDNLVRQDLRTEAEVEADIVAFKQNQAYLNKLANADQRELEAATLRHFYTELSGQVDAVRAKPGQLLADADLPVDGLGIGEDNQVTINGLPVSTLSTGEQLDVAVDIAVATLGDLKVVLVDGLERLDRDHADQMLCRLAEAGVQAFVTRVTDTELTIITDVLSISVMDDEVPF